MRLFVKRCVVGHRGSARNAVLLGAVLPHACMHALDCSQNLVWLAGCYAGGLPGGCGLHTAAARCCRPAPARRTQPAHFGSLRTACCRAPPRQGDGISVLVLSPTRELASQVITITAALCGSSVALESPGVRCRQCVRVQAAHSSQVGMAAACQCLHAAVHLPLVVRPPWCR